jgi:hypothetical protein
VSYDEDQMNPVANRLTSVRINGYDYICENDQACRRRRWKYPNEAKGRDWFHGVNGTDTLRLRSTVNATGVFKS